MTVRDGMLNLIDRFRAAVNDTDVAAISANTSAFTDVRVQTILDSHRCDFYQDPLRPTGQQIAVGTVNYVVYNSCYKNIEGTASGTAVFKLYDFSGVPITTGYTFDEINGKFIFNVNQWGSARYLDGRSYDINRAIADGWRELSGQQASNYDYKPDGRSYSLSQWFDHCIKMADMYDKKSVKSDSGEIYRSDTI